MNDAVPVEKRILRDAPISIGDKAFLGAHSIVMPSVTISEGVVVQAFSYVNKSLTRPHSIFGGQPARFIKEREYAPSNI